MFELLAAFAAGYVVCFIWNDQIVSWVKEWIYK